MVIARVLLGCTQVLRVSKKWSVATEEYPTKLSIHVAKGDHAARKHDDRLIPDALGDDLERGHRILVPEAGEGVGYKS